MKTRGVIYSIKDMSVFVVLPYLLDFLFISMIHIWTKMFILRVRPEIIVAKLTDRNSLFRDV